MSSQENVPFELKKYYCSRNLAEAEAAKREGKAKLPSDIKICVVGLTVPFFPFVSVPIPSQASSKEPFTFRCAYIHHPCKDQKASRSRRQKTSSNREQEKL